MHEIHANGVYEMEHSHSGVHGVVPSRKDIVLGVGKDSAANLKPPTAQAQPALHNPACPSQKHEPRNHRQVQRDEAEEKGLLGVERLGAGVEPLAKNAVGVLEGQKEVSHSRHDVKHCVDYPRPVNFERFRYGCHKFSSMRRTASAPLKSSVLMR